MCFTILTNLVRIITTGGDNSPLLVTLIGYCHYLYVRHAIIGNQSTTLLNA